MATADELLADVLTIDNTLVISNDLRTISIPPSVKNLGVESDNDVLELKFKLPRYIGNIDLSAFSIRINYLNAKAEGDVYTVNNPDVESEYITFSWIVGPNATKYKGNTKFNVCLKTLTPDGYVDREYNTTVASLPVLEGLEVDESFIEVYVDLLEQWRQELFGIVTDEKIQTAVDTFLTNNLPDVIGITNSEINAIGELILTYSDGTTNNLGVVVGKDGYTPQKGIDYEDGADGYTPVKGIDYNDGFDGYTPIKGIDYFDGKDGIDGKDGKDGADGYTPVKGIDYFDGKDGKDGADGYTPQKGVDYFDGDAGYTPIKGIDYDDGYTPLKGIDYYTPQEEAEIIERISLNVTGDIETALHHIIAIQNELIGGDT